MQPHSQTWDLLQEVHAMTPRDEDQGSCSLNDESGPLIGPRFASYPGQSLLPPFLAVKIALCLDF